MSKAAQTGDFFVVGGAVQPDRPCYIRRSADDGLLQSVRDHQFTHVLAPRASGKSSLMARAVRTLREERQSVAVVDLAQIGVGAEGAEADRWSYSIAYRVLRELRLKTDLQSWWQARSALVGEQRLAEFFWEVVLPNTTEPIVIFFDEIERAAGLPFAKELFGGIRSCYGGRATEPELERLNFVVLGVATPRQLCPDPTISPFVEGRAIELADFSVEETFGLAPGFGEDDRHGRMALREIHAWVSGQPFLTQKIARVLARRGGMPSQLKRVLTEQFLASGARRSETLLSHIREFLTHRQPGRPQAMALLGRVARGEMVLYDPGSQPQQALILSGVIGVDVEGQLAFRNRLFERVFGREWVRSARPFNWRRWSVAVAAGAAVAGVSVWYVRYVPRPHVETLAAATVDRDDALQAHDRLRRLPGFAAMADRLLSRVLSRHSLAAGSFADIRRTDSLLRGLDGYAALADELLDEYWLRRAAAAASEERRDEALLLSARVAAGTRAAVGAMAAGGDGASGAAAADGTTAADVNAAARRLAAELVGDDYRSLVRSFRLGEAPLRWEVDWQSEELALVNRAHRMRRLRLNGFGALDMEDRLTALQHLPMSREIAVNEPGSAGAFQLRLSVDHPAPEELLATLQAPSGALVRFPPGAGDDGAYRITASGRSPLAIFADEDRRGIWRLTLVDRRAGSAGRLIRWGLYFTEELRGWEDQPQGLAIADPLRTDQVDVELSVDGRLAIARPSRQSVGGGVALWDLRTGALVGDVQLNAEPEHLALTGDTSRILAVAGNQLDLWDAQTGDLVSRVETQTGFALPPALTDTGGHVAIAELVAGQPPLYGLLHTADGGLLSIVSGLAGVTDWMLGPEARYLVLIGPSRLVRIMDPRSGEIVRELPHARDPVRLVAAPTGNLLLSIDDSGDILAWNLGGTDSGGVPTRSRGDAGGGSGRAVRLGRTGAAESVSISADGLTVAFQALPGQVVVRDLAGRSAPASFRVNQAEPPIRTRLAPDGSRLITSSGRLFQLWRLADSGSATAVDSELTAMRLDAAGEVAVLGFRDGHVSAIDEPRQQPPATEPPRVNFIGHQGSVTSIAVNAVRNLIASGGSDGLVRAWDLDTGAPRPAFMRHPLGPVHAVAISDDGQWLASGAEYTARVWRTADGALASEVPVSDRVVAVKFAPGSGLLAVTDEIGNVFLTAPGATRPPGSIRLDAAASALAFSADGTRLATGDAAGNVRLWQVRDADEALPASGSHTFAHPVRWLEWSADGAYLLAQTDHWMHRLSIGEGGFAPAGSRFLEAGVETGAALLSADGSRLRLAGGWGAGQPRLHEIDMMRPPGDPIPPDSMLLRRDWALILGLRVDGNGEVAPITH